MHWVSQGVVQEGAELEAVRDVRYPELGCRVFDVRRDIPAGDVHAAGPVRSDYVGADSVSGVVRIRVLSVLHVRTDIRPPGALHLVRRFVHQL